MRFSMTSRFNFADNISHLRVGGTDICTDLIYTYKHILFMPFLWVQNILIQIETRFESTTVTK